MKRLAIIFGISILLPALSTLETNSSGQSLSVGLRSGHAGFFYSSLRQYGEWIEPEPGFFAWRPLRMHAGWRPYLNGHWTWTDFGWYWISSEPFGWAVFHYGRWYQDEYYGWIWVPDDVWGPAWVEWRYDDDYIGWAPLPPYASFSISAGIRFTTRWYAPAPYWCFVKYRHFGSARINSYVLDEGYSRRLIRTTRSVARYEIDRDRVVNRGVDRELIERRGNLRISRAEVGETRDRGERVVRDGDRERIAVYRPSRTDFDRSEEHIEARRVDRRLSLDVNRIDRKSGTETLERRESDSQRESSRRTDQTGRNQQTQGMRRDGSNSRQEAVQPNRRSTPERKDEFRMVQPQQPRREQSPTRRESPSVRTQPQRESSPPSARKRGKDR